MSSTWHLGITLALLILCGCDVAGTRTRRVIQQYNRLPEAELRALIGDTEAFWKDIQVLYAESLLGNEDAFRIFLLIKSYADGAVAVGVPAFDQVHEWHPEMCRKVILANKRLRERYGYRLADLDFRDRFCRPISDVLATGTGGAATETKESRTIDKYKHLEEGDPSGAAPDTGEWVIADTDEFWKDVEVLYAASLLGNERAFRTFLLTKSYADGPLFVGMPDFDLILEWHPEMCRTVILGHERLRRRYGHRLAGFHVQE